MNSREIRGKIATKCHGYMFLDAEAQWLEEQGFDLRTNRLNDELLSIVRGARWPRAIVKDFEIAGLDLDKQTPQQIWKSLWSVCRLNQLGIYDRGVREENFRNGWLVDFDLSYSLPHAICNYLPSITTKVTQGEDQVKFEHMLEEAGVKMMFPRTKHYNFRPRKDAPAML
ncbi:hypothetical protein RRF57_004680 [Xylaria bambusicola]|uniref:Uncharacterized protein n=1 Tax=Xylaria bambusicola TaxID=326684 RepID=A0AAN7UAP8_9PEZI